MALSWLRGSLRWKFAVTAGLIEAVMLAVLLVNTVRLFNAAIEEEGALRIKQISPMLNTALASPLFRRDYDETQAIVNELVRVSSDSLVYLIVFDDRGRVFSKAGHVDVEALPVAGTNPSSSEAVFHGRRPLEIGTQRVGELRYGLSFSALFETRKELLRQGLLIALVELILTFAALAVVGYWLTRHLEYLVQATRSISAGRYETKVDIETSDEIGQLARHFNAMSGAIQANVQALQVKDVALNQFNRELEQRVREKETLLREIHHRVKNNLQIISSLLSFQSRKVKSAEDLATFEEARNRLKSMTLVHEKLYRSQDLSRIEFGDYAHSLLSELSAAYRHRLKAVEVRVEAAAVYLPIEIVQPLGMLLAELLTNAFKYAFADGRAGVVRVNIDRAEGGLKLAVADDGVGLPAEVDPGSSGSFGMQLVANLVEQIGGEVRYERGAGLRVEVMVPLSTNERGEEGRAP